MDWFIIAVYLVGFVYWFRNRYRTYLNSSEGFRDWERVYIQMGALGMSVFWPFTMSLKLLLFGISVGIRSNSEIKRELQDRELAIMAEERRLSLEKAELIRKAKELNIPGTDLL